MRYLDDLRELRRSLRRAEIEAEDARALSALAPLGGPFLPWTSFSMRPLAILAVVSDVAINDRRAIVECGSGNSTVYTARLLAQRGGAGSVTSLEHDAGWAALTQEALVREGLEDVARVVHAPLAGGWYDRAAIPVVEPVDVLVVDGPPGWDAAADVPIPGARAPAVEHFLSALAPGATVILDDAERDGEREIIAGWQARTALRFRAEPGGYAVARLPG